MVRGSNPPFFEPVPSFYSPPASPVAHARTVLQVRVQAGARVQAVADELRKHGLSLQNYASIREQTIGGFTQVPPQCSGAATCGTPLPAKSTINGQEHWQHCNLVAACLIFHGPIDSPSPARARRGRCRRMARAPASRLWTSRWCP